MVDQAVAKEMNRSAEHHLKATALHGVDVVGEIATALHGPVVDHRKVHEAVVGQQEEVAERIDERFRASCYASIHKDK